MPQTSYSLDPAVAVPGLLHGDLASAQIDTFIAEEDLAFGRFVVADATTKKVQYATDDSLVVAGVTVYVGMTESSNPQGSAVIKAGTPVSVLRRGKVWMDFSGGTAAFGTAVNMHNDNTNPTTQAKFGKATATATSSNVIRAVTGAIFEEANRTSALALVSLNLT